MRIGIIAEGRSDIAVITNIIKGITGLDKANIMPLRPSLKYDNTDKARIAHLDPDTHGSWTLVKEDCESRKKFDLFLGQEGNELIVIHLDAKEAADYGIEVPNIDDDNYCATLRDLLISKINEWLDGHYADSLSYAIAIQTIDSWVLTIFVNGQTCETLNPKKELGKVLAKQKIKLLPGLDSYSFYSDSFTSPAKIKRGKILEYNCSLRLFYSELQEKYASLTAE